MRYLLRHWPKLTRFLEVAGVPIDNNMCERALKMAIRNRNYVYPAIMRISRRSPVNFTAVSPDRPLVAAG
jgi:transposase IS66 family protein